MQNLNLYQQERRRRSGPSVRLMLAGQALLWLLLLGHGLWLHGQVRQAESAQQRLQQAAETLTASLAQQRDSFREPELDARLPEQLLASQQRAARLQALLDHLQALSLQGEGFVAPLQALSSQHPPQGLWLRHILLQDGGRQMQLSGRSNNQELLPLYLRSLGQSPVFAGREFADLQLQRGEDGLFEFRLRSAGVEETADE